MGCGSGDSLTSLEPVTEAFARPAGIAVRMVKIAIDEAAQSEIDAEM